MMVPAICDPGGLTARLQGWRRGQGRVLGTDGGLERGETAGRRMGQDSKDTGLPARVDAPVSATVQTRMGVVGSPSGSADSLLVARMMAVDNDDGEGHGDAGGHLGMSMALHVLVGRYGVVVGGGNGGHASYWTSRV